MQLDQNKQPNCRKSSKMPKRETNKSNQPSPVHMMKLDQSGESS